MPNIHDPSLPLFTGVVGTPGSCIYCIHSEQDHNRHGNEYACTQCLCTILIQQSALYDDSECPECSHYMYIHNRLNNWIVQCTACDCKYDANRPPTLLASNDPVDYPAHYTSDPSGVECIQITRHRNFNIGNAIKYLWRAGLKDTDAQIEDLQKAIWYINDEINRLNSEDLK